MALSSKELIARLPADKQEKVLAKKAEIHRERMEFNTRGNELGVWKQLAKLFDLWELCIEEQLDALGLQPSDRVLLAKYLMGESVLPSQDTLERARLLMGIQENLQALLPNGGELAATWIRSGNVAFDNRSPIEIIREGSEGMERIIGYLQRARGP